MRHDWYVGVDDVPHVIKVIELAWNRKHEVLRDPRGRTLVDDRVALLA